nr:hypothetical protein [Oscillospiraceae bacterium]
MKKKILALCLCVAMLAIAIVGGTLAYFTDTDVAQNVMTTGKIDISQLEQQRDATGTLVDFVQDKPLMPMVDTREDKEANPVVNGYFDPAMKNVVDKIVTVKNEAAAGAINQDAYVRTILAFETQRHYKEGSSTEFSDMHKIYIGTLGDFDYLDRYVTIGGVEYILAVKVYEEALVPQQISFPSLKQIFMAPTANNEVADIFGDEYTILALSQGTQTAGFTSAAEALNTAFGDLATVSDEVLVGWLSAAQNG